MKKRAYAPTLTVGIPAYNEEKNIGRLLDSVLMQNKSNYVLKEVIVLSDGSIDKTSNIVNVYRKKNKRVRLVSGKNRMGKTKRLNSLYQMNRSDYLLCIDADILIGSKNEISKMITHMNRSQIINVLAGFQTPVRSNTFLGRVNDFLFNMWYEITTNINNGNHIHNLHGSICMLRNTFVSSFRLPSSIPTEQGYIYMKAIERNSNGFALARNTKFYFRTASTFADIRIQGTRAMRDDKQAMEDVFGKEIYEMYKIPFFTKVSGLINAFIKNPIYTILAVLLTLCVRALPYEDKMRFKGMWTIVESTKFQIR